MTFVVVGVHGDEAEVGGVHGECRVALLVHDRRVRLVHHAAGEGMTGGREGETEGKTEGKRVGGRGGDGMRVGKSLKSTFSERAYLQRIYNGPVVGNIHRVERSRCGDRDSQRMVAAAATAAAFHLVQLAER